MKPKILLCLCLITGITVSAQITGPKNPNTFSNALIPGFSHSWINITNVQLDDEVSASFGNLPQPAGSHTDYLQVTNFGFAIPAGTIINGIKVEVKCSDSNSRTSDYSVRIVKTGAIAGDEKAAGTPYPTTEKYITYGGPTDLWGETWDYKYISDNQFGVAIAAQRNTNDDIITAGQVNNIRITVYFTYITLPVTLTSFKATMQNKTVYLNWQTSLENDIFSYNIERSSDGSNFNTLGSITGLNVSGARYNYIDNTPLPGVSYYRLNIQGSAGYQKYSQVVSIINNLKNSALIFPNLWRSGEEMNITNHNNEKLIIYFFDAGGNLISAVITHTKTVPTEKLGIQKGLTPYKIYNSSMELIGSGRIVIQ